MACLNAALNSVVLTLDPLNLGADSGVLVLVAGQVPAQELGYGPLVTLENGRWATPEMMSRRNHTHTRLGRVEDSVLTLNSGLRWGHVMKELIRWKLVDK